MVLKRSGHASLRWTVFLLVLIPLVAVVAIYSYSLATQVTNARQLASAGKVSGATIKPVSAAVLAVQSERDAAVAYLAPSNTAHPSVQLADELKAREEATDKAIAVVKGVSESGPVLANATTAERNAAEQFVGDLGALATTRATVAAHGEAVEVIKQYAAVMNDGMAVASQAVEQFYTNQSLGNTARADIELSQAGFTASEELSLYTAAVDDQDMTQGDQTYFAQLASQRQYLVSTATPELDATTASLLNHDLSADASNDLSSEEDAIIGAPTAPPPSASDWTPDYRAVPLTSLTNTTTKYFDGLETAVNVSTNNIQSQLVSSARRALAILIAAAIIGLLAVIVSIVFSLVAGRRLVRRLGALRAAALDLAQHRLPSVMARLRAGEKVDVDAEAAPVAVRADEIGQVQQAFNVVLRAAVQAGADEAGLRRGLNDVFRNLARRNQTLLHRQLALLDSMERRAEEPALLEDLFRIDHMTTRMRRHAEGLIILAGESPGRRWSQPVPFIDVLRAATAEVEDYTRIHHAVRTDSALAGNAVADVVHLLAELIENAAVFSPPNTRVQVHGETVGRGFAIEIEDRGLGIPPGRLDQINSDLAGNPAFDLGESDRLGLFITGRLASRHGIRVSLQPSAYGGTTAIVIIPLSLVVAGEATTEPPVLAGRAEPVTVGAGASASLPAAALGGIRPADGPRIDSLPAGSVLGNGNGNGNGSSDGHHRQPPVNGYLPDPPARPAPGPAARPAQGPVQGPADGPGQRPSQDPGQRPAPGPARRPARHEPGTGPLEAPVWPPPADAGQPASPWTASEWWAKSDSDDNREAPPAALRPPAPQPPAPQPARASLPERGAVGDEVSVVDGLPVRVPQASIAPQLREQAGNCAAADGAHGGLSGRPREARPASAEAARSSMASLQAGLRRGRDETGEYPAARFEDANPERERSREG